MQAHFDCEIIENDKYKETLINKLNKIIDEEYIYSVDNLVDILKIQRVYIQKEICSKLDNFDVDRVFKTYIRACHRDVKAYGELSQYIDLPFKDIDKFIESNEDVVELVKSARLNNYKLTRRILISKKQLKTLLLSMFSVEIATGDEENPFEYLKMKVEDVDMILEHKLENQSHLKDYFGVKTELQVYRRLAKNNSYVIRKYVIQVESESKKGLARYLVNRGETADNLNKINEHLYISQ